MIPLLEASSVANLVRIVRARYPEARLGLDPVRPSELELSPGSKAIGSILLFLPGMFELVSAQARAMSNFLRSIIQLKMEYFNR